MIDPLTAYASSGPGLKLADDITLDGAGPYALAYYDLGVYGGGGGSFDVTVGLYTNCPGNGGTLIPGTEFTFTDNPDYGSPVFLQTVVNPAVPIPNSFWVVATFSTPESGWFRAEQAEIGYTANVFGRNDPPWVCNYWYGGDPYAGFWAAVGCVELLRARAAFRTNPAPTGPMAIAEASGRMTGTSGRLRSRAVPYLAAAMGLVLSAKSVRTAGSTRSVTGSSYGAPTEHRAGRQGRPDGRRGNPRHHRLDERVIRRLVRPRP